ncbi:MAG: hypothetical protein QOJ99_1479 [Bryobacterales bacterium]|jgi:hypothetical protein|nr:hypothetical protein [Bryobacterales bacterium]
MSRSEHLDISLKRHHHVFMRTTLTLDDGLAERLAQLARESGVSFRSVVNDVLRRGLADQTPSVPPFDFEPRDGHLRPGIDERRLNELAWQLDEERFLPGSGART